MTKIEKNDKITMSGIMDLRNLFTEQRGAKKNLWFSIVGILLSAFLLYQALIGLNWTEFIKAIQYANYKYLVLLLPMASVSYYVRALRWRVLLSHMVTFPVKTVFYANMAGYLGNSFLPVRMGEVLRSYLLGKKEESFISYVLATAITERVLDFCVLVIGVAIMLRFYPGLSETLLLAVKVMAFVCVAGLFTIVTISNMKTLLYSLITKVSKSLKVREALIRFLDNFLYGLRSIQSLPRFELFFVYTLFIWVLDIYGSTIVANIVGQSLRFPQGFLLIACLGISSALPSTPGYIGVYQFVAVMILLPFGFTRPDALAFILMLQGIGYITVTFWGLLGLFYFRK